MLLYDRFFVLGFVRMLDSSVFFGLPKCAWKGAILVILFGISLIDSIISVIFSAMVVLSHMGSMFIVASLRFNVCIKRSTIPEARWSCVGENFSFMFLSLQYISNALDLNACAWSQRMLRGIPWNLQHCFRNSIAVCVSQLV